ncbi:MAG: HAD-IA family hydrolase [Candidatus Micrarchaeota archaeon]
MLPFWLSPYLGRVVSALVLIVGVYLLVPELITGEILLLLIVVAYLAGHWVWFLWRKYIVRKVIAFDVGGVIAQGDYFTEHIRPMPGMYEMITETRKSYITVVLSNNNRLVDPGFRKLFKSDDMFDMVFYSSDLGAKKPDVGIYKRFIQQTGVSPHQIIFFDDDAKNVEAAKSVGINAHVFKSASQAMEAIRRH